MNNIPEGIILSIHNLTHGSQAIEFKNSDIKEKYCEQWRAKGINLQNHLYVEEILDDLDSQTYKYIYQNLFKGIIKLILKSKEKYKHLKNESPTKTES